MLSHPAGCREGFKSRFNRKWCSFHQNSQYRHVDRNVARDGVFPGELEEAIGLTTYAVMARYPVTLNLFQKVTYLEALSLAEKVLAWAKNQIS